ncbi:MAG: 4-hydroxythreonine-4-phosphate dehydrogenase PdxA [Gammaproteobacteria bacterium]|nr:4-hydroxythreonine-4-phosphate dehydrogenase PdxA [Gammaproteobacteria bacterium]
MKPTSNTDSKADPRPPRLALTAGEPAGIGPDLIVEIAQRQIDASLLVFTDPLLIEERAATLGHVVEVVAVAAPEEVQPHRPGLIMVSPVPLAAPVHAGQSDPANARHVLDSIRGAVNACQRDGFDAVVTGPVNKAVINTAGFGFSGHTEYLAELAGGALPVMMLMNDELRVALVTTHLPLAQVSAAITPERVDRTLRVLDHDLRVRFGIDRPRLLVLGLNPHAGEQGYLGREEVTVLAPVLSRLRAEGMELTGPVAADTAFTAESLRGMDAVVAMYHDQGLPALKARGFGGIVNVTLGLPFIRTSVDHGTAEHLAATGKARPDSMLAAIACAARLAARLAMQTPTGTRPRASAGVDA